MKLSWFSPLPPDHTEIGNYTARMLPGLASAFDLTVYTETKKWTRALEEHCPIQPFTIESIDWKRLNMGGLPVYHIGNNIHFHGEIISVARKCPGVVVMHDLAVHEAVLNLCLHKGSGRPGYFEILHKYGGEKAVQTGRGFLEQKGVDANQLAEEYPLFEYVLENAAGVITHNPMNASILRQFTPAPMLYAPLPYTDKASMRDLIHRRPRREEPYNILIFGFLGSTNRRLQPFLEAFSESPVRDRFTITLAGIYPENEVTRWIQQYGITKYVRLRGYLDDAALDGLLSSSDLAMNLRWPSRGESSATLLRIWNHSLPSIVTDTNFYSTLPRDAVSFVSPQRESEDINKHLEAFAEDPEPYFKQGLHGREHLETLNSVEAFISSLQDFLPVVEQWRGKVYLQQHGRAVARNYLAAYPDPGSRGRLTERCAQEIATWG